MTEINAVLAETYADIAINAYDEHNIQKASIYWNKIYDLNLELSKLSNVMKLFSDEQVYVITDYLRKQHYKEQNLL